MVMLLCLPVLGQDRPVSQTMPSHEHSLLQTPFTITKPALSPTFSGELVRCPQQRTTGLLHLPFFGLRSRRKQ